MASAAERKTKERQAKRDAGLVRVEVWVKPYHRVSVQQHAERLKVWDKPKDAQLPKVTDAP